MPIFEYYCPKCDPEARNPEDVLQVSTDEIVVPICECGQAKEKKISAATFILKGSGFYATDYKPKPPKEKE